MLLNKVTWNTLFSSIFWKDNIWIVKMVIICGIPLRDIITDISYSLLIEFNN